MYNISDLSAMSDDKLKEVAESMGIKKFKPEEREAAIYHILDEQAIKSAAETAQNAPEKKRRQPRDKNADKPKQNKEKPKQAKKQAAQPKTDNDAAKADAAATPATAKAEPEKKRRGRKPAAEKQAEAAAKLAVEAPNEVAVAAPAEQPMAENNNESTPAPVEAPVEVSAEVPAAAVENNAPQAEAPQAEAPQAAPEQPAQQPEEVAKKPVRDFRAGSNSSFGSFFPRSEGRRFVPRSQQEREQAAARAAAEREQAAAAAAAAPIVIAEPEAQTPAPAATKTKKGRKTRAQAQAQAQAQPQPQVVEPQFNFDGIIKAQGVLEIVPEGYGFLRSSDYNYLASPDDIYVTQQQIKKYALRPGDVVECTVRAPRDTDKYFPMSEALLINGRTPEYIRDRKLFEHLTPLFPDQKFDLTSGRSGNLSTRVVDMFSPIGKGQRGLIVAPPKTGKTMLLKDIANAIAENHPETYIMILLIDERPEEVTDMMRSVNAEVIASTFDEPADQHVKISQIVLDKAKRMVECGHDVVILLDSITRLARAYNTVAPASGKILSGGVDANALQKPKRFFGAARNIENGGSLTIIATALTETSSRMDEVIFEEFKGTGNMELQLDRKLSNKRIFPAVDIIASSTRRDDLLLRPETLNRMWILRRFLGDRNSIEAMEFIKDRMERTSNNDELLRTMSD